MFGLGDTEFILILIFAFLLFGPDKLPSMGRTIGRGIKQFRQASDSVTKVVKTEVLNPLNEAAQAEAGAPKVQAPEGAAVAEPLRQQERPTETFAERRARLAREREEREAAAAAEAAIEADAVAGFEADEAEVPTAAVAEADAKAPTPAEDEAPDELETPATAATVASMWALDAEPEEPAPAPEPEAALAATGEGDATVPTA